MIRKFCKHPIILIFLFMLTSTMTFGSSINLYEQAKTESKVIGSIDSKSGIVSIFTTPDGAWIKVGDPRNGNTGWVKSNDLEKKNLNYNLIKTSDGLNHYQVVQYGSIKPFSTDQISQVIRQIEIHQQAIHRNMQHMMYDMFADARGLHPRMFMPVFIVPIKEDATKKQNPPPQAKLQVNQSS